MNLKYVLISCISLLVISSQVYSQEEYKLWEGLEKPWYKENSMEEYEKEMYGTTCVFDITEPTLSIYKARGENTGTAIVIIPGGGYNLVAMYHEGYELAEILADNGITAAVLKYRLPDLRSSEMPHKVPVADARRALYMLHEKAEKYGITNRIGVIGFSAGSHLSTTLILNKDDNPWKNPDFAGLIYGVTRLTDGNRKWLEEDLYYRPLTEHEIMENTFLSRIDSACPPCFLVHSFNDDICAIEESTMFAQKLYEHKVPSEMHLFPSGGHGFGIGRREDGTDQWVLLFINWLLRLGK